MAPDLKDTAISHSSHPIGCIEQTTGSDCGVLIGASEKKWQCANNNDVLRSKPKKDVAKVFRPGSRAELRPHNLLSSNFESDVSTGVSFLQFYDGQVSFSQIPPEVFTSTTSYFDRFLILKRPTFASLNGSWLKLNGI